MSEPLFLGMSLDEAKDAIRNLYAERDAIKRELSEKIQSLAVAQDEVADLKAIIAHTHYCTSPDHVSPTAVECEKSDKLLELLAHSQAARASAELKIDALQQALTKAPCAGPGVNARGHDAGGCWRCAALHHAKHGAMDGSTCLLSMCAIHYSGRQPEPRSAYTPNTDYPGKPVVGKHTDETRCDCGARNGNDVGHLPECKGWQHP